MAIPTKVESGFRLFNGDALNIALATPQWQNNSNIVALAGGALSANTPVLVNGVNEITTAASGGDSVVLPKAAVGLVVFVANAGASSVQVFGNGSDTINGTAGAMGVAQANGKSALYVAADEGQWYRILSA